MIKKIFFILITLFFWGCSNERNIKENEETKKYKVAINFEHPPLLYKDEKTEERKGFIYDIAKEIETRGNFIFIWDEIPISKIFDEVARGNYDIGFAAFILTKERKNIVNMTEHFYGSNIIILGNRNIDYSKNKNFIYGVQAESTVVDRIDNKNKIIVSSKEKKLINSLINHEIDYIAIDDVCGNKILKEYPQIFQKEIVEEALVSFITSKTLDKNDMKKINSIILEMKHNGEIDKLKKKYDI